MSTIQYFVTKVSLVAILGFFGAAFVSPVPTAHAAGECSGGVPFFMLQPWTTYLPCKEGVGPSVTSFKEITGLVFWVADSLLKVAAYIALAMVIWGGIKYIKADGETGAIAEAKNTILEALIGLGITISSVAIVNFVSGVF
ncbi:hypothetical protein JNJ66_07000 [Candidatus Saccharibacteria bacterium]|nr:hypothetical protein [Candidatus Saccharibacteria bacterium]